MICSLNLHFSQGDRRWSMDLGQKPWRLTVKSSGCIGCYIMLDVPFSKNKHVNSLAPFDSLLQKRNTPNKAQPLVWTPEYVWPLHLHLWNSYWPLKQLTVKGCTDLRFASCQDSKQTSIFEHAKYAQLTAPCFSSRKGHLSASGLALS